MAITEAEPSMEALERAGFASWPAARVIDDDTWQIRLSPALPYKRTNSINCLDVTDGRNVDQRLASALAHFRKEDVKPTLRSTPLTPPELIAACSNKDWSRPYSESLVMTAPLHAHFNAGDFDMLDTPAPQWIANYKALTMNSDIDGAAISNTLNAIQKPVCFFQIASPDQCLGVAVAVVQEKLVGLFGLAVAKPARRTGLGRALSHAALAWGASQGATTAWLQVEADNRPAEQLYHALGFTERYRYAYRSFIG